MARTIILFYRRLAIRGQGVDSCEDEFRNWKDEREIVYR